MLNMSSSQILCPLAQSKINAKSVAQHEHSSTPTHEIPTTNHSGGRKAIGMKVNKTLFNM